MNLINILKYSLQLPKKDALFKLNRINMRDTFVYIIILFLLLFLPDAVQFVLDVKSARGSIPDVVIIQVVFLYPALTIFITTLAITLLAGFAYLIKELLKRKLAYHQLWKMSSYALTLPIFFYLASKILNFDSLYIFLGLFIVFIFIMTSMIQVYPQKK
ncbi:DUF1189 domain-containing protein [Filobacillus milosensis]|uniref:DUF1189 domain-containing protein n=1 Tax=Filobacillus milosensis TaxID=94137 RepID=A0A4Y8IUS3_9BACI|nr:DUF1189 family protein [Filobacillus milosensis]TFB24956.1 DUF1189 domain-containing protein [Filobacillus milosensis]